MTDLKHDEEDSGVDVNDKETFRIVSPKSVKHLGTCRKICFSVGHALNDITAAMWFTYFLVYMRSVMKFRDIVAGYIMLLGQFADGISTPLVGYESDRILLFRRIGCRKSWYLIGTICVAVSFPFLYNPVVDGIQHSSEVMFVYYAPFVILFQFGWASTQISHLALIPELTTIENERIELNSWRYACTVFMNIFVFSVAWLLLSLNKIGTKDVDKGPELNSLQPQDADRFRILVFAVLAAGLLLVAIFFAGTKEHECDVNRYRNRRRKSMSYVSWFKEPQFYMVGGLYMCSRIFTNITQIYLPMFLLSSVHMEKSSIATVPLIVYTSGFTAAFLAKKVQLVLGRKATYFIGIIIGAGACVDIYYLGGNHKVVYFVACLIGFSGSTLLVTALAMIADLIDCDTDTGAFVYGSMSFTDKVSNGVTVVVIQHLHPKSLGTSTESGIFYRNVMTFVPAATLILSTIFLASLFRQNIGTRRTIKSLRITGVNERSPLLKR